MTQINVGGGAATPGGSATGGLLLARQAVIVLFGIVLTLLAIRIILCFAGADRATPMVGFVTDVTSPLVIPFEGVLSIQHVTPSGHSALDVGAMVAMAGYGLLAILLLAVLALPGRRG